MINGTCFLERSTFRFWTLRTLLFQTINLALFGFLNFLHFLFTNNSHFHDFSISPPHYFRYQQPKCCPLCSIWPFLSSAPLLRPSLVLWELLLLSSLPVRFGSPNGYALDLGSAYGTAKAGVGVCSMGVFRPDAVMKNMLPVIMAGILGIYGLIASIIMVYVSRVLFWPFLL